MPLVIFQRRVSTARVLRVTETDEAAAVPFRLNFQSRDRETSELIRQEESLTILEKPPQFSH